MWDRCWKQVTHKKTAHKIKSHGTTVCIINDNVYNLDKPSISVTSNSQKKLGETEEVWDFGIRTTLLEKGHLKMSRQPLPALPCEHSGYSPNFPETQPLHNLQLRAALRQMSPLSCSQQKLTSPWLNRKTQTRKRCPSAPTITNNHTPSPF